MNEQNRFNEYLEKLQRYWDLFINACYIWIQKAGTWIIDHGKQVLQLLAILLLKVRDLLEQLIQWAKAQVEKGKNRLESKKTQKAEALPPVEEAKALPEEVSAEPQIVEAVSEPEAEVPAVAEVTAVEEVPAEPAAEAPAAQEEAPEASWTQNPYLLKAAAVVTAIGKGIKFVIQWIWKLRKVIMAVPVIWTAVKLAMENMERLPESVGLDIQSTGEFARMITRQEAVYWPLGITLFCLLLMFLSKKPLLPWVISIFTLVLPWLIWILNYYA